jgi:hypothetical protein
MGWSKVDIHGTPISKLLAIGFTNAKNAPCLFMKHECNEIIIVASYVDDLNLFGINKIMLETIKLLKCVFETQDMGKTLLCLGLQFERLPQGVFLHQSTYTR